MSKTFLVIGHRKFPTHLKKHLQRVCPLDPDAGIKKNAVSFSMKAASRDAASRKGLKLEWESTQDLDGIYRELVTMATQPAETGPPSTYDPA